MTKIPCAFLTKGEFSHYYCLVPGGLGQLLYNFLLDLRFSFTYNLFNCGTYETLSKIKKS